LVQPLNQLQDGRVERIAAKRAVDLVADHLRATILAGAPPAGSRLAPERELALELGVNRLTLRAALARLEAEGLVRARQGDGVRVLPWRSSAGIELVPHLLRSGDRSILAAFLELRRAVAAEAVALAAARIRPSELAALDALAEAQATENDPTAFARRDLAFGRAVLEAARNVPMLLLLNTVERVFDEQPELFAALHADRQAVRASYPLIVGLLRSGDGPAAAQLVRSALEAIDALALERLGKKRRRGAPR
jgi:DNA-binding FadR family transcriptional regulator